MKKLLLISLVICGCAGEGSNNLFPQPSSTQLIEAVLPNGRINHCGDYSYAYSSGLVVVYGNRGIYEIAEPGHLELRGTRCSLDFDGTYLIANHDNNTVCTFRVV